MILRPPADRHRVPAPRHYAIVGAGIAGVACARTLVQAGHRVSLFEREASPGGRMASESTPFGRFDSGAQYFTVRDPRFARALETADGCCRPWSANLVRVLDPHGRVAEAALPGREQHWVAQPGMDALVAHWAAPLGDALVTRTRVTSNEPDALDAQRWQLRTEGAEDARGIEFPQTPEPNYWDFIYFATCLGMTFQVSDMYITSSRLRKVVMFHCLAAFVFNLGILAFTINVLGGG